MAESSDFASLRRGYTDRVRKNQYDRTVSESGKAFNFAVSTFNAWVMSGASNIDPSFHVSATLAAAALGVGVALGNSLKHHAAGESSSALTTAIFEYYLEKPWFRKDIYRLIEDEQVNNRANVLNEIERQFGKETLEVFMSLGLDRKDEFRLRCYKIISTMAFGSIATVAAAALTGASGAFTSAMGRRDEIDKEVRANLIKASIDAVVAIPKKAMSLLKISEMKSMEFSMANIREGAPGLYLPLVKAFKTFAATVNQVRDIKDKVQEELEPVQLARESREFDQDAQGNRTDVRNLLSEGEAEKYESLVRFIEESGGGIQNVERLKSAALMAIIIQKQMTPAMVEKAKIDDKRFFEINHPKLKALDTAWNKVTDAVDTCAKTLATVGAYAPLLPSDLLQRYETSKSAIEDRKAFDKVVSDQERLLQEKINNAQGVVRVEGSPKKSIKLSLG